MADLDMVEIDLELSDEDDDIMEYFEYARRPYVVKERRRPFDEFDDLDFLQRFRLTKPTVLIILNQIEHLLETPTDWNHSVSPINQLLLTLRFYASGCFLLNVADEINISKSCACNIVRKVTHALAGLAPNYIQMPLTDDEINRKQMEFHQKARLPRIIGSLDCTHVKIQNPGGDHAELFRNRKGYFSLNVQTISDVNLKILNLVARWPGSTHDQIIFENSNVCHQLENGIFGNSIIVADSGYRNTRHVITPLLEANTELEQLYNEAVRRTRNPVERQYGVWKRRFPILAMGCRLKLETTMAVIVACGVLHNVAIEQNEALPNVEEMLANVDFNEDIEVEPNNNNNIDNARDEIIYNYLPRLFNNE